MLRLRVHYGYPLSVQGYAQDVSKTTLDRTKSPSKLQEKVRQLNTPEVLDFVLDELFAANTLDEAIAVIHDGIHSENRQDK